MDSNIEKLKKALEEIRAEVRDKGPSHKSLTSSFCLTREVIKIFQRKNREDSKEAEKILSKLLFHWNQAVKTLVLHALLDAKNESRPLNYQTEIGLIQFKNNPANQEILDKVNYILEVDKILLQAEKAPFN